jgi:hypothetical protein
MLRADGMDARDVISVHEATRGPALLDAGRLLLEGALLVAADVAGLLEVAATVDEGAGPDVTAWLLGAAALAEDGPVLAAEDGSARLLACGREVVARVDDPLPVADVDPRDDDAAPPDEDWPPVDGTHTPPTQASLVVHCVVLLQLSRHSPSTRTWEPGQVVSRQASNGRPSNITITPARKLCMRGTVASARRGAQGVGRNLTT